MAAQEETINLHDGNAQEETTNLHDGNAATSLLCEVVDEKMDIKNVIFEQPQKKSKGRPLGTIKKRTCGAPVIPCLQPFTQKTKIAQAKILLKLLVEEDHLSNILEGSYLIDEIYLKKFNEKNLKDTFMDVEVKLKVLKHYLTKAGMTYLQNIIEKKNKKFYSCGHCGKQVKKKHDSIRCDMCLLWYHASCVNINLNEFNAENSWYCKVYCDV